MTCAPCAGSVSTMPLIDGPAQHSHRFTDPAFASELTTLLRQARWDGGRTEEVLATAARIRDRDPDSWVSEWVWTAGETWAAANRADVARHGGRSRTAIPAGGRLLRHGPVAAPALRRGWSRRRPVAPPSCLLGGVGGPRRRTRRAHRDPLRRRFVARVLLPRPGRARRAAAAGDHAQRRLRADVGDVGARRRRRRPAGVSLDDLRRARPAGGAARARVVPPARLGACSHRGARHGDRAS